MSKKTTFKLKRERLQFVKELFEEKVCYFNVGAISFNEMMESYDYFDEILRSELEDLRKYRNAEIESEEIIQQIIGVPIIQNQVEYENGKS